MFNKDFFKEHQKALLWVASNRLFSWLLGLNRLPKPIGHHKWTKITPNSLHYLRDDGQYEMVAFTRPRFAEALAFNVSPFMASSDFKLMTRMFSPAKYAGLFTMFLAAQKGIPLVLATTTSFYTISGGDSDVKKSNSASWAGTRGATIGESVITGGIGCFAFYSGGTYNIHRSFAPSVTDSIGSTSTVSAASLFMKPTGDTTGYTAQLALCATTQASTSTVSTEDYDQVGSSKLSADTTMNSGTNFLEVIITDLSAISKTDVTKIGFRHKNDFDNITPTGSTGADQAVNYYNSSYTGTTRDPYYSITYTIAAGVNKYSMMNVL